MIYGASDEDDWTSEATWYKANPSLGETIDIEKVRNAYISAKENVAEENIFRQLRLNQWVKQSTRWMQMDKWNACAFFVNEEELIGRTCYGGLDLSSTSDITAFVLVFPPRNDEEKYIILPYCWIPEDNMRLRVRRDHVPYDVWAAEGSLETTEGNVIHYGFIEKFIEELGTKYHIKEIAFDRWGATQMVQDLEGMGFTVVPFGQGYKDMSPPTKELMKLTLEERIAHGGHKVLRWMMDNVYVRQNPAGNIKMDKEMKSIFDKITKFRKKRAEEKALQEEPVKESSLSEDALPEEFDVSTMQKTKIQKGMSSTMSVNRNIDNLMNQLEETFSQRLLRMIDERGMTDSEAYTKAYVDRRHFSKIRKDVNYVPNKKTVLAFTIALELSLDEAKDLLASAGFALSRSSKTDIIVAYFLQNKIYDMFEINDVLDAYGQPVF